MKETVDQKPYIPPFLRALQPDANEEQLVEATENLRAYLVAVYDIYKRIEGDLIEVDSQHSAPNGRVIDKAADVPEL